MTQVGSSTPSYDANGNATNDTAHTYSWDAAGKPVTVDGVNLTYDALGRMVEQNKSGTYNQIVYTPTGGKLAIMQGATLQKAFVSLTGGSQAIYTSTGLAYYRHSDWIGSSRFASTPTQTMYYDGAYAPFGEVYAQTGTADLSFTGMNQDTVPNLYDFPARELNEIHGRWPSPDPAGLSSTNKRDPQKWNRYTYARNSPLHITDPTGMYLGDAFGSQYDGDDGVVGATCYMCGGYNAPEFWGSGDLDLYGDLLYDIPGNQGFGQDGAEEESRHVSIMTDGWDPELEVDQDTTDYWFDNAPNNAYEDQKEFDAIQVGQAACAGGDAGDIASCIQQVYDTMGDANGAPSSLVGGNYNFSYGNVTIDGQSLDPSSVDGCSSSLFGDRCGDMPSIHFDPAAETFHVDTANPLNFPIGTAFHLVVDYVLGKTALSSGIPR